MFEFYLGSLVIIACNLFIYSATKKNEEAGFVGIIMLWIGVVGIALWLIGGA